MLSASLNFSGSVTAAPVGPAYVLQHVKLVCVNTYRRGFSLLQCRFYRLGFLIYARFVCFKVRDMQTNL